MTEAKQVKERPILFSGEMVKAILDGRKTQTRRIVTPQPEFKGGGDSWLWRGGPILLNRGYGAPYVHTDTSAMRRAMEKCCHKGQVGDQLWVKETYGFCVDGGHELHIRYPADHTCRSEFRGHSDWIRQQVKKHGGLLRPSIFMPRWASRITLEIAGVRVERLQDISNDDALAEGIEIGRGLLGETMCWDYLRGKFASPVNFGPVDSYYTLWESINGDGSWEKNSFVWVIEFKRV